MAAKIPKYVKANITKIKTRLGICICCEHLRDPIETAEGEQWYVALCDKSGLQCFATRSSLVTCKFFSERKGKPFSKSFKDILRALVDTLKGNDWKPLKDAINNELQN